MTSRSFGDRSTISSGRRAVVLAATGLAALAGSGAALFWPRRIAEQGVVPEHAWAFLLPGDRLALARLIPGILTGQAGFAESSGHEGTEETMRGIDQAISLLPPATRDELRQLFDLLSSPGGRSLFLGFASDWANVEKPALINGLEGWRTSRLGLLRSAYEGLRDIVFAVWYGNSSHWTGLPNFGWKGL